MEIFKKSDGEDVSGSIIQDVWSSTGRKTSRTKVLLAASVLPLYYIRLSSFMPKDPIATSVGSLCRTEVVHQEPTRTRILRVPWLLPVRDQSKHSGSGDGRPMRVRTIAEGRILFSFHDAYKTTAFYLL